MEGIWSIDCRTSSTPQTCSAPLPGALELLKVLGDEDHSRSQVIEQVKQDPATVAALIKASSMADKARGGSAKSLEGAVASLGENAVRRIVINNALGAVRIRDVEGYGLEEFAFWRMSVATAYAAERLATEFGMNPAMMYVVGLLLDLGKPLIATHIPTDAWDEGVPPSAVEKQACGFDHATVGAELASTWGLWEPIPTCIRFHHRPAEAPEWQREVAVAHLASWTVHWLGTPMGLDALNYRLDESAVAALQVNAAAVEGLAAAVADGLTAA